MKTDYDALALPYDSAGDCASRGSTRRMQVDQGLLATGRSASGLRHSRSQEYDALPKPGRRPVIRILIGWRRSEGV